MYVAVSLYVSLIKVHKKAAQECSSFTELSLARDAATLLPARGASAETRLTSFL